MMATTTSLIETFQSLNVADDVDADQPNPTCLPFNPGRDFESAQAKAGRVDRYLFRLFDKHSDGCTNHVWVKSRDAEKSRPTSNTDIFARADRRAAAQALRRHLQWDGQPHQEDNFVSWTSSLLVVLQYAFYRSQWFGDLDFAAMNLCVVDTSLLPDGAFLNDMALIEAFSRHDSAPIEEKEKKFNLTKLNALRKKKHINFSGSYYFGEYLSQGALNIEACSSIVSMGQIIDDGLGLLRPELANPDARNGQWANRVIALREAFYTSEPHGIAGDNEVAAAVQIGQAYGPSWELPVALAFLALKPRPDWDGTIIKAFRKLYNRGKTLPLCCLAM